MHVVAAGRRRVAGLPVERADAAVAGRGRRAALAAGRARRDVADQARAAVAGRGARAARGDAHEATVGLRRQAVTHARRVRDARREPAALGGGVARLPGRPAALRIRAAEDAGAAVGARARTEAARQAKRVVPAALGLRAHDALAVALRVRAGVGVSAELADAARHLVAVVLRRRRRCVALPDALTAAVQVTSGRCRCRRSIPGPSCRGCSGSCSRARAGRR